MQWAKDTTQIKNLMKTYSDEEVRNIIHTVITQYKKRWSKPMYPAPTIPAMCGWMATPALEVFTATEKAKTAASKWDELENSDEDLIL